MFLHKRSGRIQAVNIVSWQVLHLHKPSGPSPCTAGPIELQEPAYPAVITQRILHGLVLLHRGLCHLLTYPKHSLYVIGSGFLGQEVSNRLLVQALYLHVRIVYHPLLELGYAVRILQPCDIPGLFRELLRHLGTDSQRSVYQYRIEGHPANVNGLVNHP